LSIRSVARLKSNFLEVSEFWDIPCIGGASCLLCWLSLKGVLTMATFPVTIGARLLGIHPKTLHHWLKAAAFPLAAHPSDARLKCVAEEHLLELAKQHGRPLPALSEALALERDAASACAAEQVKPLPAHTVEPAHRAASLSAPAACLVDLLQQLAQLHTQVATLQHQLTALALTFLPEQTGRAEHCLEHRLHSLEGQLSQTLESLQAPQQTDVVGPLALAPRPAPRLLPAEVRARSRVTALIEYGAQGQYVAVCPKLGVLALVPDSPAWFDWLASLTSFRGCRDQQGASRLVVPPRKVSTPAVGRPGAFFMATTSGTTLGSPTA
jgi:DNA-binding transcriptional MerR regulator